MVTPKNSLGVSPCTLVYRKESIPPQNILLPYSQLNQASRGSSSEVLQARIDTLLKMEELQQKAKYNFNQHQVIIKRWFDKRKYGTIKFDVGDLVLKWDNPHAEKGKHTKLQHLWIGPYLVTKELGLSTYKLQDIQGQEESILVNGLCLKHYFT